jgi:hypothetical protein
MPYDLTVPLIGLGALILIGISIKMLNKLANRED